MKNENEENEKEEEEEDKKHSRDLWFSSPQTVLRSAVQMSEGVDKQNNKHDKLCPSKTRRQGT